MQDVNRFLEASDIDDAERTGRIAYTNFLHAGSDRRHGLEIVRCHTPLDTLQLIARVLTH